MDQARYVVAAGRVGLAVLFEINRKELSSKPHKPFDSMVEQDTWVRYKDVFRRLLCFITRMEIQDEPELPYELTAKQDTLFDALDGLADSWLQ
jgi:hypothetical protein